MEYYDPMTAVPSSHAFINPQSNQFGFQGTGVNPRSLEEELMATLLIRHLPEAIPHDILSRLLSHYGASAVRPCSSGRLRNCAFVDFKNEALASQAQRQLNGLRLLGKVLSVQRATKSTDDNKLQQTEAQSSKVFPHASAKEDNKLVRDYNNGSKSSSVPTSEPIAARLGVDYQFPPHLEYAYPPPDGNILTNIVNALIAVPRFYTQVLHLMNKMNIPAPFRMALPTPPLPSSAPAPPPPPPTPAKLNLEDLSSSESEMESSDEEDASGQPRELGKARRKRARRESIVGPAVDKDVAHEAVGVKPATLMPKEMLVIKKKNPVLQIKIVPKVTQDEHKDTELLENVEEPNKHDSEFRAFLTPEELESGKLPPEELLSLPMFKNYTAGNPASVLYIKNLAKEVTADDFYIIFGSLFGSIDAAKSGLSVKLMQEGRMRGQAFVTFASTEVAVRALTLVNGYVFKGKPMIIQFGRNPGAVKAN